MEPYRAAVPATIAQYGGRFLIRGGATELVEGGPEPKRVVILEFADTAAVKRWYNSPEYQKILPIRFRGRSLGTLNLCHEAGWFDAADAPTGQLLASLLVVGGCARSNAASQDAPARKLAVLLHRMLVDGSEFIAETAGWAGAAKQARPT